MTVLIYLFTVCCTSAIEQKSSYLKTVLVLGQSNTIGWGDYDKISSERKTEFQAIKSRFLYLDNFNDQITNYRPTKRLSKKYLKKFDFLDNRSFCPIYTFAIKYGENNTLDDFLILRMSNAGRSLYGSWNPSPTIATSSLIPNEYNPNRPFNPDNLLYKQTLNKVELARNEAHEMGYKDLKLEGVLFFHGEKDAMQYVSAITYERNLKNFILNLRNDLGIEDLPFIIQQTNAIKLPFVKRVRIAQENVSKSLNKVVLLPTTMNENFNDYPKYSDKLHYDTEGVILLGEKSFDLFSKVKF